LRATIRADLTEDNSRCPHVRCLICDRKYMLAQEMLRKSLSWFAGLGGMVAGRRARRWYLALLLLLVMFSGIIRVRSYLMTRKFQAVLAGLAHLKVDSTPEARLVETVPYLVRDARECRKGTHLERGLRLLEPRIARGSGKSCSAVTARPVRRRLASRLWIVCLCLWPA